MIQEDRENQYSRCWIVILRTDDGSYVFRAQRHIRTDGMFMAANLPITHRKEQFRWIGGEIDLVPAKHDEFATRRPVSASSVTIVSLRD